MTNRFESLFPRLTPATPEIETQRIIILMGEFAECLDGEIHLIDIESIISWSKPETKLDTVE